MNLQEIKDFKEYVVNTRNSKKVASQKMDQDFFLDDYPMPLIKDSKYQIRTGFVAGTTNTITNQMIGNNPRAFTQPRNDSQDASKDSARRVASEANRWLKEWNRQYRNPYRASFKHLDIRGEKFIYLTHNPEFAQWEKSEHKGMGWTDVHPDAIPVTPVFYDPMVVFVDPSENIDGRPSRVVICYQRSVSELRASSQHWGYQGSGDNTGLCNFFLYVDKDTIYSEGEDYPLFFNKNGKLAHGNGMRVNLYEEVPVIHVYSGLGIDNQANDPDLLAFSKVRMQRNLITEASTMHSDIAYTAHREAHNTKLIQIDMSTADQKPDLSGMRNNVDDGINFLILPDGAKYIDDKPRYLSPDVYAHVASLESKINMDFPGVLRGNTAGTSGRADDRNSMAAKSIYDSMKENNDILWADTISLGMRMAEKLDILPKGLKKGDIARVHQLTVDLGKEDPIEQSRLTSEGMVLVERGLIDHKTFLMKYNNKTEDQADKIIAQTRVDIAMKTSPEIQQILVQAIVAEMGQEDKLALIQQTQSATDELGGGIGSQGGPPRSGNFQSPQGLVDADQASVKEGRLPPR